MLLRYVVMEKWRRKTGFIPALSLIAGGYAGSIPATHSVFSSR
jgi:hypothetical protein